jgi:hypothetical protein
MNYAHVLCSITQLYAFGRFISSAGESVPKRFFFNESDLSSLHNRQHVVDHQSFLKDNQKQLSKRKVSAGE